ncbi:ER membrane protein complex subunit 1 [Golovinomyces cichoracearum]|uniref:ER membrane protein complex subunit 1 n=1 Tax=Golovinomyces cichoracearum TaxID=62708 RepID=A0A420II38_9PEZI|nr:ER membrane protein complex subunit 1 [Golovinomyces cichoracearum]
MQFPYNILGFALIIIPSAIAILADGAYDIDYHYDLLGLPLHDNTFFYRPRKDDKATLLYTLSDMSIIGAINPSTGKLVWRQKLPDRHRNEKGFLRGIRGKGIVISGMGQKVDFWDSMSGISICNHEFSGVIRDLEVIETAMGEKSTNNVVVLFEEEGQAVIRLINADSGDVIWEYRDLNSDIPWKVSGSFDDIFLVSLYGAKEAYNVRVTIVDPIDGRKRSEYSLFSRADVRSSDDLLVIEPNSAAPIVAWTDRAKKNINVNILTRSGAVSDRIPVDQKDGSIGKIRLYAPEIFESQPHFLLYIESEKSNKAEVYHVDIKGGKYNIAYELPRLIGKGAITISCEDSGLYFTQISQDEAITVSSTSNQILGRWPVNSGMYGDFIHAASEVVQRSENSYAVRSAVLTKNETYILVRNGVEAWARYEGLSGAVAAEWADIHETKGLAATLQAEAHSNILDAYLHRVRRHIHDLRYLPQYINNLPRRILSSFLSTEFPNKSSGIVGDKFGFNKLVVIATLRGSIYALQSNQRGAIAWSLKAFERSFGNEWDVKGMWANNSHGIITIRGADGEILVLNATTGLVIERTEPDISSSVETTAVVQTARGQLLLPIQSSGIPFNVSADQIPNGLLVTRSSNYEIQGVVFEGTENVSPLKTWEFKPGIGQKNINVISRPYHDPVASIGRVLGDRNVLYKYLNPNIVLVTAVSDQASTASFYLIDAASGQILYSTTHEAVDTKQPITSALTENWFVYSLWSDTFSNSSGFPSSKGYQIVVSELFESEIPNDRGPLGSTSKFSSLEPSDESNSEPAIPHVKTQSYLIPEPISHMSFTQTRQGITSRQLICVLEHSNAIIGIPYRQLDPRRPVGRPPTSNELEEGLFEYQPYIEFNPNLIITHEREVFGVKGIIASPAFLESTSLIFAYGLDIFGTRVAPSFAFDILGKDFNKLSLVLTIMALTVGVGVLAPMAKRKQINRIWMTT